MLGHDMDAEQDELPGRLISAHAEYNECFDVAKGWLVRMPTFESVYLRCKLTAMVHVYARHLVCWNASLNQGPRYRTRAC